MFATSITRGANAASPSDDIAYTPNVAVCSNCHTTSQAKLHMEQNGGSFSATKNADGTSNEAAAETCQTCHGPGKSVDVKVVHKRRRVPIQQLMSTTPNADGRQS